MSGKINDGEWRAFLSWPDGHVATDPADVEEMFEDANGTISIRRGSALPDEEGKLPREWKPLDIFGEADLEEIEPEDRAASWELAQKAAWGMNQPAEERVCGATRRVSPDSTGRYVCVLDPGHEDEHSSCPGDEASSWARAVDARAVTSDEF